MKYFIKGLLILIIVGIGMLILGLPSLIQHLGGLDIDDTWIFRLMRKIV